MSTLDPVAVFRMEAAECLEAIEAGLLDLTHQLDDKNLVDAVFRGLHTLKGSGAMFGFEALAAFTHHCETAFDRVRKGEVPATAELVAAVLAAQDHMRALVEHPDADHGDTGQKLLAQLQAAVGGHAGSKTAAAAPQPAAAAQAAPPAAKKNNWRIRFSLPSNSMANGTNPLGLLDELRDLGECTVRANTAAIPPLAELSPTELYISWEVMLSTEQDRSAIDDVFIFVMDDMELEVVDDRGARRERLRSGEDACSCGNPCGRTGSAARRCARLQTGRGGACEARGGCSGR